MDPPKKNSLDPLNQLLVFTLRGVALMSDVYLTGAVFTYHFEFALNPVNNNSPIRFTSHGQDNNFS